MLTIPGHRTGRFCDGIARRDFLKIGGLMMGGLSLPQILRAEAQSGIRKSPKSVIMIYMAGAPPHQDIFDLKMDAPLEIRGPYHPISTKVPTVPPTKRSAMVFSANESPPNAAPFSTPNPMARL